MSDSILPLPDPDGPLAAARPAGAGDSLCQGDRVWLRVNDRTGLIGAATDGGPLLESLEADVGPCGNVLVEPGRIRRELLSSEGVVLEDHFALPRLPGARLQWSTPDGRGFRLEIGLRLPETAEATRDANRLSLCMSGGGSFTEIRVHPEPERLELAEDERGAVVRIAVRAGAGGSVQLCLGGGARQSVARAAADCLDHFEPHLALQDGWLSELASNHLRTRTEVSQIDHGLEWAKARASGLDPASLDRLRAQLALGLFREAGATLDSLSDPPTEDFGRALAQFLLWSGDHDAPARRRQALERWMAQRRERGTGDAAHNARLVEALDGLGYPDEAEAVRRLPTRVEGGTLTLPMAGSTAVSSRTAPNAEEVWMRFRELAERCAGGATRDGLGSVDPGYALVHTLLDDILGARPEAGLGRLELSPAFPGHLRSFHLEGLRAGRGGLDFRMDRDGARYRFLFGPTSGAMPINVIFQPSVPGTALRGATVDGEAAELDWASDGQRTTPRLQLPIDGERAVEFEVV